MGHLSLFVYLNSDEVKEDEDIEFLKTGLVLDYYKNYYMYDKGNNSQKNDLKDKGVD